LHVEPTAEEVQRAKQDGVTLWFGTLRGVFRSDWQIDAAYNLTGQYVNCTVDTNCSMIRCDDHWHGPWQYPSLYRRQKPNVRVAEFGAKALRSPVAGAWDAAHALVHLRGSGSDATPPNNTNMATAGGVREPAEIVAYT
jgi:hypothetical protein